MPGFLLHVGATVICAHGGQAQPTVPNPRVLLSGQPSVLMTAPYVIAGCPLVPPPLPPCVTAQWVTGTVRVTSNGQPLLVQSSQSICVPNGTPLLPLVTQTRVSAE
jgi:hypothetical protein